MKKKLSLLMVMLVAMITSAWADTVVLSSPAANTATHSDANGIITISDATESTGIQTGSGSLAYEGGSATPMKLSSKRQFNLSYSDAVTITKVMLYGTSNSADATATLGVSSSDRTSLGTLPAKGGTPAAIDITSVTGLNASAQFLAVIVVEYSSTAPSLTVSPTALSFSLNPSNPSAQKTFTLTGKNLTNGTYNLSIPTVTGLTIEPTSFTVASGAVNQVFTVTYASTEDVAKATIEISTPTIDNLSATVAVTYQSRATAYSWATVSDAATWDWSKLTETVELTDETTPNKTDEFLLADLDDRINFVDAFGDPKAIKMEAMQYPSRGGFAQGIYVKFKTATAGTIDVEFSNTGGNRPDRYLQVNGQSTTFKSNSVDIVSATSVPVPAGEVVLSGWLDDGNNSAPNMLRWYNITYTPSDPEPVVMPDEAEDWSVTEGICMVGQTDMPLTGQTAKVAFEESGDVYMQVSVAGATVTLKGHFNSSSNLVTFPKGQTASVSGIPVYLMGAASLEGSPTDIEFKLDETQTTLTQHRTYIVASTNKNAITPLAYIQNLKLQKPADEFYWEKTSSITIGDVVLLTVEKGDVTKELSGFTSGTTYGAAADYTTTPEGLYPLTVEAGSTDGTFSFKNEAAYLNWTSGNSLITSETKDANSSWSVTFAEGVPTVANAADNTRKLQYNASNPRFACYTSNQSPVTFWKKVDGPVPVPDVATPVISGETPFVGETEVTITCETEGAKIYYTTDGTDPTTTSTEYTEAFTITETTTVKAIVAKDDALSEIVSKKFTAVPAVATLAAANALDNNSAFAFTGNLLVIAKPTNQYVYVEDENASGLIYDQSGTKTADLGLGTTIAANWIGHISIYHALVEMVPDQVLANNGASAQQVVYESVEPDFIKLENVNQVVKLEDVTYVAPEGTNKNFSIYKGDAVVPGYNQFGLEIADAEEGKTYDIVGAISRYNDNVQFQPITIEEHVAGPVEPTVVDLELNLTDNTYDIGTVVTDAIAEVVTGGYAMGDLTVNLSAEYAYTTTKSIVAPKNVTINGNGATVNASGLTTPFIQMATIAEGTPVNDKGAYVIDGITIKNVTITGLPYQLIYSNTQKYLMNKILVDNCVIGINGTAKKTIFDFNGGGNASEIIIDKSTLWANPSNEQNGGLFSSQSGHGSIQDLGSDKQLFAITNSTIYNIAYGKTTNTQRRNSTAGMEYKVENSAIVNSGKSGQFIVGLNGGSANSAQTYTINNNIFNFDGADVSAAEETKVREKIADATLNSVAGIIAFTSTETPDFGGTFTLAEGASAPETVIGDPRWSITFEEAAATAPLYIIGGMNGWNLDAMTEMTFNAETQAYEYTYAPTEKDYFVFSDKQFTAEEAADEQAWELFNQNNRYALTVSGNQIATLNTALPLVKATGGGTIVVKPVKEATTYKISVAKDLSTVTIAGESAPEPDYTFIVAGTPAEIFGTEWDASNQANLMEKQNDGTYAKTYTVDKAYESVELKVVKDGSQWIGDAYGQNVSFSLFDAGSFTVTIDPETNEITVTGDNVMVPTGFDYSSVYAVGNGSEGWLNGQVWTPNAEANKMTKVDGADDVWEITFKGVPATPEGGDWYQVKFAIDGSWDHNFGGTFAAFGEATAAAYNGDNIAFALTEASDVTLRLDLTNFDIATKQGAKFTITLGGGEEPEPLEGDWIAWGADDVTASAGLDGKTYGSEDFLLTLTDTNSKMSVDANSQFFGDATQQYKFTHRLKTGGKSQAASGMKLTIAKAGELEVYVRSGSGSATDRNLVLKQNGTEIFNQIVKDEDAIEVEKDALNVLNETPEGQQAPSNRAESTTVKVFPAIKVTVAAGEVEVAYPVNSLNFYAFCFKGVADGIHMVNAAKYGEGKWYTMQGVEIPQPTKKGLYIHNGRTVVVK